MSNKQTEWSMAEASVLLEGYLSIKNGKMKKKEAIETVSRILRAYAGIDEDELDSTFRNQAGITFQMASMESAVSGKTVFKPASKLFIKVVSIYRDYPDLYIQLVEEVGSYLKEYDYGIYRDFVNLTVTKQDWEIEHEQTSQDIGGSIVKELTDEENGDETETVEDYLYQEEKDKPEEKTNDEADETEEDSQFIELLEDEEGSDTVKEDGFAEQVDGEGIEATKQEDANDTTESLSEDIGYETVEESVSDDEGVGGEENRIVEFKDEIRVDVEMTAEEDKDDEIPVVSDDDRSQKGYAVRQRLMDLELRRKYPLAYPRLKASLKDLSREERGASVSQLMMHIGGMFRMIDLKEILDWCSWAVVDSSGIFYSYSDVPIVHDFTDDDCNDDNSSIQEGEKFENEDSIVNNDNVNKTREGKKRVSINDSSQSRHYYSWLLEKNGCAVTTARSYASAIHNLEKLIQEQSFKQDRIYGASLADVIEIYEGLQDNEVYIASNKSQNNRLRSAICRYIEFLGGESPRRRKKRKKSDNTLGSVGVVNSMTDGIAYSQLMLISKVYDDPRGYSLEKISDLIGNCFTKEELRERLNQMDCVTCTGEDLYSFSKYAIPYGTELRYFDRSRYEQVLENRYSSGMRFDSIDFDNFRLTYESLFDEELSITDEELELRLRNCGFIYKGMLFPAEGIMPMEIQEKLLSYVEQLFDEGNSVVYYRSIYSDLSSDLAYCFNLTDEHMLAAYLKYLTINNHYYFFSDFVSVDKQVEIDHTKEISDYLMSEGRPLSYEELDKGLPHLTKEIIRKEIRFNKSFISDSKEHYFHINSFELSDEERDSISEIIENELQINGYATWGSVYKKICQTMPIFVENNACFSSIGIRNALGYRMEEQFSFDASIISRPNQKLSVSDVFRQFAINRKEFTGDDLKAFSDELSVTIAPFYILAVEEISVRVARDLFVLRESVKFDVDAIDNALDSYFVGEYVPIKDIDSFLIFPYTGYDWNEYLLESYLLFYSERFKLLSNGLNMTTVAGAVARKTDEDTDFAYVCAMELCNSGVEISKDKCLNYLVEHGFLAKKSYKDIERVLNKARRIRNRKG